MLRSARSSVTFMTQKPHQQVCQAGEGYDGGINSGRLARLPPIERFVNVWAGSVPVCSTSSVVYVGKTGVYGHQSHWNPNTPDVNRLVSK